MIRYTALVLVTVAAACLWAVAGLQPYGLPELQDRANGKPSPGAAASSSREPPQSIRRTESAQRVPLAV